MFGLVFYDFEFSTINDDDAIYTTSAMEEMLNQSNEDISSCDGFSLGTNSTKDADYTECTNNSRIKATSSIGTEITRSQTLSNSIETTSSITYGQSINGSVGFSFPSFSAEVGVGFSFDEMYQTAYNNSESNSVTTTDSSEFSYDVPAYSKITVSKNTKKKTVVVDYKQAVAIKYKTAVVAISGGFYDGGVIVDLKTMNKHNLLLYLVLLIIIIPTTTPVKMLLLH